MGMEVLGFEVAVDQREQHAFGGEPSFLDHIRSQAAITMAEKAIRESACYQRIDPTEEELLRNPCAPTRHRWRIGIQRDMSEIEARERQMGEARMEGRKEAAAIVRKIISMYSSVDGPCKHVIMDVLEDAAVAIEAVR